MNACAQPTTHPLPLFACNHCGKCCDKILIENSSLGIPGTFGLLLRPFESRLFPPDAVRPMWRFRARVLAYQMVSQPCPLWSDQRCIAYTRRPLACRAYPVSWQRIYWLADSNCPQVTAIGSQGDYREQILAAQEVVHFFAQAGSHENLEYFDLKDGRWKSVR